MAEPYKYKAFISYSHADEKWARWLHRALESYKPPRHLVGTRTDMGEVPEKMAPVFRDREELASSTDLGADLTAALEASACQIVICSMSSARSHWVNEEILAFKRLGRAHRVFSLIVDGEPYASAYADTEKYECFPQALRFKLGADGELTDVQAEPIAADARPGKDGKNHAKIKLLAGMLGVGFDDLRQRELQRRNRRLAVISGAAVAGMVVAIGLAATAVIARNEADAQRLIAQEKAETARRTADFMVGLFEVSDPSESRGRSITAREILEKGARRIEAELSGEPTTQATLMNTMGRAFTGLGLYGDSLHMLEQALARRRQIAAIGPVEMNESLHSLATLLTLRAEYDRAETLYLEAIETLQSKAGDHSEAILDNFAGLAELYFQTGQYELAEPVLRRVLAERRQVLGPRDPAVADAMEELGLNMFDQGRYEEAERLVREALDLRTDVLGGEPHPDISANLTNLGMVEKMLGRYDETEKLYQQALAMDRLLHGEQHPDIALDLNNLAEVYLDKDELEKAELMYLEALAMQSELLGDQHPEVARIWSNLAFLHYYAGDLPGARDSMQKSIGIWQQTHGEEHPDIARSLSTLGRWLAEAGESAEAELMLRKALAQQEKLLEDNHENTALTRMALADLLNRDGRAREALREASTAEQALRLTLGDEHWWTVMSQSVYGSALAASGDQAGGEKLLLDSYQRLAADDSAVRVAVEQALLRVIRFYEASENANKASDYLAIHQRDYVE
jgi:tetratricopeptide (TPR) repeat protein